MAAHGADADAEPVDGNRIAGPAENLVRFRLALPFLPALPVPQILVDPGDEGSGEGRADIIRRETVVPQDAGHLPVDIENRRRRVIQRTPGDTMNLDHL